MTQVDKSPEAPASFTLIRGMKPVFRSDTPDKVFKVVEESGMVKFTDTDKEYLRSGRSTYAGGHTWRLERE